jgi:hypothetical protein
MANINNKRLFDFTEEALLEAGLHQSVASLREREASFMDSNHEKNLNACKMINAEMEQSDSLKPTP